MTELPGFFDIQINGHRGHDFSDPDLSEEAFVGTVRRYLDSGAAALLPTVVTSPERVYERNLPLMAEAIEKHGLSGAVPGFHIEGPFISPEDGYRGAHTLEHCRPPEPELLEKLQRRSGNRVRILTMAAELDGAVELTRAAAELGIRVFMGHQAAGEGAIAALADAGAVAATHLGNGIISSIDRHRNPIWPVLADDRLGATVITDGHHVPRSLAAVILRCKPDGFAVVSDASRVAGLPPGRYSALGTDVELNDRGRVSLAGTDYLAGSGSTILQCMNVLAGWFPLNVEALVKAGRTIPAELAGIDPALLPSEPRIAFDDERRVFYPHGSA
jgi:N-acetylglucosamine-6-phosphate deacetylase